MLVLGVNYVDYRVVIFSLFLETSLPQGVGEVCEQNPRVRGHNVSIVLPHAIPNVNYDGLNSLEFTLRWCQLFVFKFEGF